LPIYYFDLEAEVQGHDTDGGHPGNTRFCRGCSDDYDVAVAKAVGECLERTTLLYYRQRSLVRSSPRALRARRLRFVDPRSLTVFSTWQTERRPELAFDDDTVFGWERVTSLHTSEEALAPAQAVYWNYSLGFADAPEPLLREQNTNGAGGHYTPEAAVLSGLLECVQRDSFFRKWLRREPAARIDASGVRRPNTVALLRSAREVGLEPMFLDYTSPIGVPTCLCVLVRSDGGFPYASAGASSRLDGETALHDALIEAASVHHVLAPSEERVSLPERYEPFVDPTFPTLRRLLYWANPAHAAQLSLLHDGRTSIRTVADFCRRPAPAGDAAASLEIVSAALRRHGHDAWYFLAKHPVLSELGYAVARVVVPGLLPMFCEQRNAPLGYGGLAERDPATLAPVPHPFP
jgi:thiazole/oxazole-forming peptide maturase SagD family component